MGTHFLRKLVMYLDSILKFIYPSKLISVVVSGLSLNSKLVVNIRKVSQSKSTSTEKKLLLIFTVLPPY